MGGVVRLGSRRRCLPPTQRQQRAARQQAASRPRTCKHKRRAGPAAPGPWYPGGEAEDLPTGGHLSGWDIKSYFSYFWGGTTSASGTPAEQHIPDAAVLVGDPAPPGVRRPARTWGSWGQAASRALTASRPLLCLVFCLLLATYAVATPVAAEPAIAHSQGVPQRMPSFQRAGQPHPHMAAAIAMALPNPAFHAEAQRRYTKDPDGDWSLGMHPEATAEQMLALREMLKDYRGVSASELHELPGYCGAVGPLQIQNDRIPAPVRQRRHSPRDEDFARAKVQEMLDAGIIRPSQSTRYACEYTCAAKKDAQGDWSDLRFCNDFRPLNDETPLDKYPLPHPEDIFNQLGTSRFFSKMDLKAGFNQIPVAEEDMEKTAFWCAGQKYEYVRMPFGLKNAPIHFQRIMDTEIERHGLRAFVRCFIDDLIIYSSSAEEHIKHIQQVMHMLEACNLRFHPSKSVFMTDSVEYLGHFVGPLGLSPAAAKV